VALIAAVIVVDAAAMALTFGKMLREIGNAVVDART